VAGSDGLGGRGGRAAAGSWLAVGTELAGYRIESLLGRGGMGVVYRAHDLALDRKVALKLLAPELAEDVRFRERFLRESRLAASLDHPAIIPIYEAGEVAGQLYIAMRVVEGTDLKRLLAEEGVLEVGRALGLIEQVADALDAAHERGLVHRDVKPSNILVDGRGHCYLADFGLSRRMAEQATGLGAGRSLGTVEYVAPEQIRGDELDGRADLYSLGCLLYECLAGRPPFAGGSETAIVFAHLEEEPPGFPGLEPVFRKALAKEPGDRYQSGHELVVAAREGLQGPVRPRRRRLLSAAVLVAVVGAAVGSVVASRGTQGKSHLATKLQLLSLGSDALNLIDAKTHRVGGTIGVGKRLHIAAGGTDVAFSGGSAWVLLGQARRLLRVDLATKKVIGVVKLPWAPGERIASGGGFVWVTADRVGAAVVGIDVRTGRIARRFTVETGPAGRGIAFGDGSLWLAGSAELVRVDAVSGRVLHRFSTLSTWVAFADGAVWVADGDGSVAKIDPIANRIVARTRLGRWLSDLTVGDGFVWVSVIGDNAIYKLSEDDLSVQKALPSGADPERLSTAAGQIWVANTAARVVSVVAEDTGARQQLVTGSEPATVMFHDGFVWTGAAPPQPPLPKGGVELRISLQSSMNADPVQRGAPIDDQLSYATCANLLNYADSAGPDGTRLRPEIAAAIPSLSHDGRTYTFRIRPGFRFSPPSNEAVTAETFRHTIERTLSPHTQQVWPYAPDIVGASAYSAGKAAHISGIAARGDTLSIALVKPAGDFLTRISMDVFCPVPLSVPVDPRRAIGPIASAGPYYIATIDAHRTVLERNPNYTGHRPRRAARIVFVNNVPTPKAVALADSGQLDYVPPDFHSDLLAPGGPLDRRYGPMSAAARAGRQRYFLHVRPLVDTMVFNTRRPLFRDVRLRQAVNYALDRRALATAYFDAPAEGIIPQAVRPYETGHVYPINRPDLRTARLLAGRQRRRAVLLAPCDPMLSSVTAVVRSELARIGIAVTIVLKPGTCDPRDVAAEFKHADLMIGTNIGRGPTDRDPAPFFDDVLTHGAWGSPLGPGPWNAPAFRARLKEAGALSGRARVAVYGRLDDELSRAAPLVVYGSFLYDEYFSPRVGCKVFQAFYLQVDLGALCVQQP
jgi:ABC-type transport system substrate-binding protein/DNA-binding beta-propeller fold protein YncE